MYKISDELFHMIMAVRETGKVNMFDIGGVQQVAMDLGHSKLALFLTDNKNVDAYGAFILTGEGANPELVEASYEEER